VRPLTDHSAMHLRMLPSCDLRWKQRTRFVGRNLPQLDQAHHSGRHGAVMSFRDLFEVHSLVQFFANLLSSARDQYCPALASPAV
jgi:hypothetical protein